jgi:hypothetical protein
MEKRRTIGEPIDSHATTAVSLRVNFMSLVVMLSDALLAEVKSFPATVITKATTRERDEVFLCILLQNNKRLRPSVIEDITYVAAL